MILLDRAKQPALLLSSPLFSPFLPVYSSLAETKSTHTQLLVATSFQPPPVRSKCSRRTVISSVSLTNC
jgi:hypothetical protein